MVTKEEHRTLCETCSKTCVQDVPFSGSCTSYDHCEHYRLYEAMPEYPEIHVAEKRNLSPKEFGMSRKHNRRRK